MLDTLFLAEGEASLLWKFMATQRRNSLPSQGSLTTLSHLFPSSPLRYLESVSHLVMSDSTPWALAHQAPLSMGFSRQEYLSGWPFHSPGDLPNLGTKLNLLHWKVDSLLSEPPGSSSIQRQQFSPFRWLSR